MTRQEVTRSVNGMDGVRQEGLGRYWAELERQFFEGALFDPARYEGAINSTREAARLLDGVGTVDDLYRLWPEAASKGLGIPASGECARDEKMLGAAFSMRARSLREIEIGRVIKGRLAWARQSGSAWTLLEEQGDPEQMSTTAYRSLEMHVASGWAIYASTEPGAFGGSPACTVFALRLDPDGGMVIDPDPAPEQARESRSEKEFQEDRHALRAWIENLVE